MTDEEKLNVDIVLQHLTRRRDRLAICLDLLTVSQAIAESVVQGEPDRELAADFLERMKQL